MPFRGTFAANNSETLRQLALDGLGIALLPDFSALQPLRSGKLVRVLPKWRSVERFGGQIYAIRPYSAQVPRAISVVRGLPAFRTRGWISPFRGYCTQFRQASNA